MVKEEEESGEVRCILGGGARLGDEPAPCSIWVCSMRLAHQARARPPRERASQDTAPVAWEPWERRRGPVTAWRAKVGRLWDGGGTGAVIRVEQSTGVRGRAGGPGRTGYRHSKAGRGVWAQVGLESPVGWKPFW